MRIALIVIVSLVGFGGGFVGVYLAMPEPLSDEIAADSTALLLGEFMPDSLGFDPLGLDSLGLEPEGLDSLTLAAILANQQAFLAGRDSLVVAEREAEIDTLTDSLSAAKSRLQVAEATITQLESRIAILSEEVQDRESRKDIALGMATTLPKLDLKDLGPILGGLDQESLLDLYGAASSRNRPTILQALDPDRAALLVQQFLNPDQEEEETTAPSDSTDT